MRRFLWITVTGTTIAMATAGSARAQLYSSQAGQVVVNSASMAPGVYGTSWGYPSFGGPRTYSVFSSPYGPGYGYGYYPYVYTPVYSGGLRMWRPGGAVPGYVYGHTYFALEYAPYLGMPGSTGPGIGSYAPGFGPSPFIGGW
jgi:hypothetical protein